MISATPAGLVSYPVPFAAAYSTPRPSPGRELIPAWRALTRPARIGAISFLTMEGIVSSISTTSFLGLMGRWGIDSPLSLLGGGALIVGSWVFLTGCLGFALIRVYKATVGAHLNQVAHLGERAWSLAVDWLDRETDAGVADLDGAFRSTVDHMRPQLRDAERCAEVVLAYERLLSSPRSLPNDRMTLRGRMEEADELVTELGSFLSFARQDQIVREMESRVREVMHRLHRDLRKLGAGELDERTDQLATLLIPRPDPAEGRLSAWRWRAVWTRSILDRACQDLPDDDARTRIFVETLGKALSHLLAPWISQPIEGLSEGVRSSLDPQGQSLLGSLIVTATLCSLLRSHDPRVRKGIATFMEGRGIFGPYCKDVMCLLDPNPESVIVWSDAVSQIAALDKAAGEKNYFGVVREIVKSHIATVIKTRLQDPRPAERAEAEFLARHLRQHAPFL